MSAIWPKSQLQRLCELARAERAKKDKTLKHPGKDAGIEESNGVQGVQTRLKRKDRFESK